MKDYLMVLAFVGVLVFACAASADVIPKRPTGDALQFRASHTDTTLTLCMFRVGEDYLDPANHRGCTPMNGVSPITSAYPLDRGEGDLEYRAVAVDAGGRISEPSADAYGVEDIPPPPALE